jgi:hypothetical protein
MEVVENSLDAPLSAVLDRPLFCFLAQRSAAGPRVSPLWFLWEDRRLWLVAQLADRSYPERVRRDPRAAVAVVDFDPAVGRVHHVGMRGEASLEPYDDDRATRLFRNYLGDPADWPDRFLDLDPEKYRLVEFRPETVVARDQSYGRGDPPGASGHHACDER